MRAVLGILKKNKNISKSIVLRLAIVVLMFAGAMAIDMCHDHLSDPVHSKQDNAASHNIGVEQVYFFNPVSSFKLLDRGDKLLTRVLFFASQDKFLAMFHNHRAFHTLKEDSLKDTVPLHLMAHFMKFTSVSYTSPDDYPPVS